MKKKDQPAPTGGVDTAPPRTVARNIIKEHGPAGGLVLLLRRYTLAGWALFGITLLIFVAYLLARTIAGVPVLAVSPGGKVLGTFQYVGDQYRTDQEYTDAVARWLNYYLSYNSSTIYDDVANTMSAMYDAPNDPDSARALYLARLKATNLPNLISQAGSSSYVQYDTGYPQIVGRKGPLVTVRAKGTIMVHVSGISRPQKFDVTVRVRAVPRSTLTALGTLGIQVMKVWEN